MRPRTTTSAVVAAALAVAGCFYGDENDWANRKQIMAAAERCDVPDLEPTRAGTHWAAYVADDVPGHEAKEDCIYADLAGQGLLATR